MFPWITVSIILNICRMLFLGHIDLNSNNLPAGPTKRVVLIFPMAITPNSIQLTILSELDSAQKVKIHVVI